MRCRREGMEEVSFSPGVGMQKVHGGRERRSRLP
jgi:hypothetical protein